MSDRTIAVVIPVFLRDDVMRDVQFLRVWRKDVRLRFFVIDNGNRSELSVRLKSLEGEDCRVIRLETNCGGAGAFRAGMQAALEVSSDYLWLLDDDALVNEKTLPELIRTYEELESRGVRVGAVGSAMLGRRHPDVITEVGCGVSRFTGRICQRYFGLTLASVGERVDEVDYVAAASLLVRAAVVREVGLFEDIFIHCDDMDWCLRLREKGFRNFATTRSTVNHMEWEEKFADWLQYYDTRNVLWMMRRHFPVSGWCAAARLYLQLLMIRMHGRRYAADLMRLGFCDAWTGRVLLRSELPPSPVVEISLADLRLFDRDAIVVIAGKTRFDAWRVALAPFGKKVKFLPYDKNGCVNVLKSVWRHLRMQLLVVRKKDAVAFVDVCCTKNNPLVMFGAERYFFYLRDDRPVVLSERCPA